jgi:hypothetical protein
MLFWGICSFFFKGVAVFGNIRSKPSMVHNQATSTNGVCRKNGTVQKDWAIANSYDLPDTFGVVVRGHEGWDRANPDAIARFTLVISFEALGADVKIYERIQLAVEQEIRARVEEIGINV